MTPDPRVDEEEPRETVSAIVQAGGRSRRMGGVNKALLPVGGRSIIRRVTDTLRLVFSEVLLVTNNPDQFDFLGLPMVRDIKPGYGSLGGLYTGLSYCATPFAFLAACDMPFLREDVIRYLVDKAGTYDVIIPRLTDGVEPMHAIYSTTCLPALERLIEAGDLKIMHLFEEVTVLEVPEEELIEFDPALTFVMNVNTPEDLRRAREIAKNHP